MRTAKRFVAAGAIVSSLLLPGSTFGAENNNQQTNPSFQNLMDSFDKNVQCVNKQSGFLSPLKPEYQPYFSDFISNLINPTPTPLRVQPNFQLCADSIADGSKYSLLNSDNGLN